MNEEDRSLLYQVLSVFVFHPNIPQFPITSSKTVSSPPHNLHIFQYNEKRIEHWRYCTSVSSGGFVRWGIHLAQESKIDSFCWNRAAALATAGLRDSRSTE